MNLTYILRRLGSRLTAGIAVIIALQSPANAWIVEFDELASGTVVTSQYSQFVVFSSSPGHENYAVAHPLAVTQPNMLGSGGGGTPSFMDDTFMDFAIGVRDFEIAAVILDGSTGVFGQARIFENGILTQTRDMVVTPGGAFLVQFLGLDNMTRLELVNLSAPVGWDQAFANVVPEPGSLLVITLGLATLFRIRRLRHATCRTARTARAPESY